MVDAGRVKEAFAEMGRIITQWSAVPRGLKDARTLLDEMTG
jgi:hypothetical protein